jgi:hypothetical protein
MPAILLGANETQLQPSGGGLKGFLLDENIPSRISFAPSLPVIHATDLGPRLTDSAMWEYARANSSVM